MSEAVEPDSVSGGVSNTSPIPEADTFAPGHRPYWTLFVLGVVILFTVLDRQVLALMIEPIKADYGISDTQAALLLGAFSDARSMIARAFQRQSRQLLSFNG